MQVEHLHGSYLKYVGMYSTYVHTYYKPVSFLSYTCIVWQSLVPFQMEHALNEEVKNQGLSIIDSISFPSHQNVQTHVQKLQVGA